MVADLAVALTIIGIRTLVAETVRGTPMTRDSWAEVAADVVDALVKAPIRPNADPVHVGERLGRQIAQLNDKIDSIPVREFEQRMAAGRRFLRDLPRDWRTDQERRELIRDARGEFVRAAAGAELMNDPRRRALAEVAIAGCWLWVPSIPDVKTTVAEARRILEEEILFGPTLPTSEYADVLKLCRAYGERSAQNAAPIMPRHAYLAPTPGARLAVAAVPGAWVECAGIELSIGVGVTGEGAAPSAAPSAAQGAVATAAQAAARSAAQAAIDRSFVLNPPGRIQPRATRFDPPRTANNPNRWSLPNQSDRPPTDFFRNPPARNVPTLDPGRRISVEVRNTRDQWISLRLTRNAVIVQVAAGRGPKSLPNEARLGPGGMTVVELERPAGAAEPPPAPPATPTVGFVLPPPPAPKRA